MAQLREWENSIVGEFDENRDLVHRGIEVMAPETPVAKLALKMRDLDIGAIPVGTKDALQATPDKLTAEVMKAVSAHHA